MADYTLEELKRFNVNKPRPEYAKVCRIPTLREVLEALKDTGLTVNIELKTGVNFYEGIERKTVELVRETGFENRVLYSSFNHHSGSMSRRPGLPFFTVTSCQGLRSMPSQTACTASTLP